MHSTGIYHKVKEDVLPQIMDWTFLLLLGVAMALLSFILDYLIEKAGEGEYQLVLEINYAINKFYYSPVFAHIHSCMHTHAHRHVRIHTHSTHASSSAY